jgi:outer membrane autotransporter protein
MKMRLRPMLLGTTATLLLTCSAQAVPVTNFDFETGDLTGWTASCPGGDCGVDDSSGNPNFGFWGFNNDVTPGTLSQSLATGPGIFRIDVDYENNCGGECGSNSLAVQFGDSPAALLDTSVTNTYLTGTTVLATNAASPLLEFQYITISGSGTILLDNVVVTQIDDIEGPNNAAAAQTVAVQASRDLLDRLHDRFNHAGSPIQSASVRETVVADAAGGTYVNAGGKYRAFMNVFGSHGEWGSNAAEADRRGLSLGAEMAATNGLDVGAAFAFSRTDFDTKGTFTTKTGETYEYLGALYAHWTPSSMPLYVNVLGGYGSSDNDFARANILGTGVASDVSADQWFGSIELGWDWQRSGIMLTPFVRFDIATIEQDGYTETATGAFVPAVVAGRDFDAARSILGLRAEWDIASIGRYGAKFGAKAGWAHEFEQDRLVTFTQSLSPTVVFAGTASGARPEEDTAVVGANFEVAVGGDTSIYAGYNGNFGGNQAINAGEAGVRVTW